MKPVDHKQQRVLTTQQLATAYETDTQIIVNNFNRNKDRYVEGVDYYRLDGASKSEFLSKHQFDVSKKNTQPLYLWTESGVLMHAKSLNTDKAWEVYRHLVETYFRYQEQIAQQQELPLAGGDFLTNIRTALNVPTLKQLNAVERYIDAAKALYPQKGGVSQTEGTKQLPAPKLDKNSPAYIEQEVIRLLGKHGPLTLNTLHHSYMKKRDEVTIQRALHTLVQDGRVVTTDTNYGTKKYDLVEIASVS